MEFQKLIKNLLFIDIETVSGEADLSNLSERMQKLWLHKASFLSNPHSLTDDEFYFDRAGIYAEFGKVVVIGMSFFHWNENEELCLKAKAITGSNEEELLREFKKLIEKKYRPSDLILCAHNGKEFDYPYLCRRMLINGIEIPKALQVAGKKPWEIPHLDTLEMWKFGDKKHYTSLELLSEILDIPTSKDELSGDMVNATFYKGQDLDKIARYCREDVIVLAQLYLRYQHLELVNEDNIERI
jgi:uncharacterized protein YprB with RNaseH-like and TPR domain